MLSRFCFSSFRRHPERSGWRHGQSSTLLLRSLTTGQPGSREACVPSAAARPGLTDPTFQPKSHLGATKATLMYQAVFSLQSAVPGGGTTGQQIASHSGQRAALSHTQLCSRETGIFPTSLRAETSPRVVSRVAGKPRVLANVIRSSHNGARFSKLL